ncbi:MAG: hypothetical protein DRO11_05320 [Methanobacteriota archaeon]|nr:MAG: hypothetical protein DRO11_05320 [Euryarchaeota archaeon]
MSVFNPDLDPGLEEQALRIATLVAAARLRYGRPASFAELWQTLSCATIARGNMVGDKQFWDRTGIAFCPSLTVPVLGAGRTVGLGDAFAAGYILGQTKN